MKQKTLHVDFNDSTLGTIAREGEHNRTQLVFVLDEDLQACDFINIEFGIESSGEKLVLENLCPEEGDNTLKVSLTQDVTVSGVLTIQLVGYVIDSETSEPHMIAKSPVVSGVITPSIKGIKKISECKANLLDRILAKVHMLLEKAHQHANLKILELFACPALTDPFAVGLDADRLRFNSSALRYISDGTVIKRIKQIEKDGKQCVRLYFYEDAMVTHQVPEFIDLLVSGSTDIEVEDNDTGLKLNGIELDFGISDEDDFCTLPVVSALPAKGDEGDIVLYAPPANTITADNAGSTVCFDYSWIDSYDGTTALYSDFSVFDETGGGSGAALSVSGDINFTILLSDGSGFNCYWGLNEDGKCVFDSDFSNYCDESGNQINISEPPESFILPANFTEEPAVQNENFPYTWFYIKPELYVYCNGQWKLLFNETAEIAEIRTAIDEIKGGIDEIETMIDESGVLE